MPSWLKNAIFYEIYPQSFQDTNGDGIGDFRGIINRLDYIRELGCNAIWMNPCFDSPFYDAGYDVRDYYKAASRYGTNDELKELLDEVHKRDMHIILDLVPGHTAIDCEWFKESCKNEVNEYTHRYICIPSGNHDMARIAGKLDEEECKIIFAFLMSMPGVPFVYYGDEIGMKYMEGITSVEGGYFRTGARTPMQWDSSVNSGFSTADADALYISMDPDENRPTVEKQMQTEHSIWKEVQTMIALRKEHTALQSDASLKFLYAEEQAYPFIYMREDAQEKILVVLNPSGGDVTCVLSAEAIETLGGSDIILAAEVLYSNHGMATFSNGVWEVPAASATWMKLK